MSARSTPITLAELSSLAAAQVAAEREVEKKKGELKEAVVNVTRLSEESVPMAMAELELNKVRLSTGEEVSVKQDVYCSITEANKDEAFDWMEAKNFGGLIKTDVIVSFGKDEMPFALELIKQLKKMKLKAKVAVPQPPKKVPGQRKAIKQKPLVKIVQRALEPYMSRSVHPQTLKAFLREELSKATGEDLPLDLFSARPVFVSKITPPKQ